MSEALSWTAASLNYIVWLSGVLIFSLLMTLGLFAGLLLSERRQWPLRIASRPLRLTCIILTGAAAATVASLAFDIWNRGACTLKVAEACINAYHRDELYDE